MDICRFLGVITSAASTPVQEIFISVRYKSCKACNLTALQSTLPLVHALAAEWSWVHKYFVVKTEVAISNSIMMSLVDIPAPREE